MLDGVIDMDGESVGDSGGASGGSAWVTTRLLQGTSTGTLRARGGASGSGHSIGGGGGPLPNHRANSW